MTRVSVALLVVTSVATSAAFALSGARAHAQDAGIPDAGPPDGEVPDAGLAVDAGAPDGASPDAGDEAGTAGSGAGAAGAAGAGAGASAGAAGGEDRFSEPAADPSTPPREETPEERAAAEAAAREAAALEAEQRARREGRPPWPPPWCDDDVPPEEDPDPAHDPSICEAPPWGFFGLPRWHIAGRVDLGFLFLRPVFLFGYGTPHETYVAFEIDPLIAGRGVGVYSGFRAELPFTELRAGARYFFTFTRSFLRALDTFDHLQIRDRSGPGAAYLSLEAQLELSIPIGPISIDSETTATYVLAETNSEYPFVFEESLMVVLEPPFVWGTSLGVAIHFGDDDAYYITPTAEIIHLVEREDIVLRVGLRAGIRMWEDLELRLIAMPAIVSPDSLGAAAGDTFLLGIRYRWVTENPSR